MAIIKSPNSEINSVDTVVPINKGGTGAKSPSDAVSNFGGISLSSIGDSKGLCPIDSNNKIILNYIPSPTNSGPTISGLNSLVIGNTGFYEITNYDNFTTYNLSAISGSVSRSTNIISYTAPTTTGISGFIINGRTVSISIINPVVVKPVIIAPSDTSDGNGINITLLTDSFVTSAGSDTHFSLV